MRDLLNPHDQNFEEYEVESEPKTNDPVQTDSKPLESQLPVLGKTHAPPSKAAVFLSHYNGGPSTTFPAPSVRLAINPPIVISSSFEYTSKCKVGNT